MWHLYEEKEGWYPVKRVRVLYMLTTFFFRIWEWQMSREICTAPE